MQILAMLWNKEGKKMAKIKLAVIGYGNIGRGVLEAIKKNSDMELAGILSRSPERVRAEIGESYPIYASDDFEKLQGADVAILCGGSKSDLPEQGPVYAQYIHTVDSYDNHSEAYAYYKTMDEAAKKTEHLSCISIGWDPGTFSVQRVLGNAFIPGAKTYGFYGTSEKGGLSMGHSDALRRIAGVLDARQYTHAISESIEKVRRGENPSLKPGDMHWRECFVVAKEGADTAKIEEAIKTMPGYFAGYKTLVHFVSKEELETKHQGFPHDGLVIGAGTTGSGNSARIEYTNIWGSNSEATASILVAHARAVYRLAKEGKTGAITALDIAPAYLSPQSREDLIKNFL
jgi:diaminopimelate dehydrogenase